MGITGGICTGKSEVTKICRSSGYPVVYADELGHNAYPIGTKIYLELIKHFSTNILLDNDEINRADLGDIVFSDQFVFLASDSPKKSCESLLTKNHVILGPEKALKSGLRPVFTKKYHSF